VIKLEIDKNTDIKIISIKVLIKFRNKNGIRNNKFIMEFPIMNIEKAFIIIFVFSFNFIAFF